MVLARQKMDLELQSNTYDIDTKGWAVPTYKEVEFFSKRSNYAVIIPVMNEGERIRKQLERSQAIMCQHDSFLVDWGSTDGSTDLGVLSQSGIRGCLTLKEDGRLSSQLRIGLAHVMKQGYAGAILIDGNNKDDPNQISLFVDKLDQGFDHIQGSRFIAGGSAVNNPTSRLLGIKLLHAPLISFAAGFKYTDTTNGFRAYSRKFLLDPRVQPFRQIFSRYELHYYLAIRAGQLGMKITEVPVERVYPAGKIPTKITKYRGNLLVLQTLFDACRGKYNPPE